VKVWDEESGELHRDFEDLFGADSSVTALASFLSPDGQQARLVVGSGLGHLLVHDPEAGSVLHRLEGHTERIRCLMCIASSSAAPHHPRLVSASEGGAVKVWDGETGEWLADLWGHSHPVMTMAVWKEHTGGHDRIATGSGRGISEVKVWDGEACTLLHNHGRPGIIRSVLALKSAEGPHRLLVGLEEGPLSVWDPEEGRLLHDGINRGCPFSRCHLFESAGGRHLLAMKGSGTYHDRHTGRTKRTFLDVWDLGEAPARVGHLRPAHHLG
jgi:WD40 repeat protein